MKNVDCPQHGDTVLHLARGLVDPSQGARAEALRTSCDHCSAWWKMELEGESHPEIDSSVEQAIRGFVPPQQRKMAGKDVLVAAACLTLAAGIVLFSPDRGALQDRNGAGDDRLASSAVESSDAARDNDLILSEGFESVTGAPSMAFSILIEGEGLPEDSFAAAGERRSDLVLSSDFERGSLQDWSDHS
jgi:hypothetical protein